MSLSLAFLINQFWIIALLGIAVFNYKKGRKALMFSSLFVLALYAITQLVNANWLLKLDDLSQLQTHYLFFGGAVSFAAMGLFWLNRHNVTLMMGITIALFALEAFLTYAIHIDRNIIALNGNAAPNLYHTQQWWLWDMQSATSVINNVTVLIAVSLHKVFQVTTQDPHKAFAQVEAIEKDIIIHWNDSPQKQEALEMLDTAAQLLVHYDDHCQFKPKTINGIQAMQTAIHILKYEPQSPNQTPVKKALYWLRS